MQSIKCKLAEFGLSITNKGTLAPCCQYIYNSDQQEYNYKRGRTFEVKHRQGILLNDLDRGRRHSSCKLCWLAEDNGKPSLRQVSNELYKDVDVSNREVTKISNPHIVDFELSTGNLCNLKCVMCGPYASTQWHNEMKKNRVKFQFNSFDTLGENDKINKWWEEKPLVDFICSHSHRATKINFTGGEPFMFPKLIEVLDSIYERNKNPDLVLQFNTNATISDDNILDSLSKFSNVRLVVSLEGIDKHNDYIRFPSKWHDIDKNIKKFQSFEKFKVQVHHTLQPSSVYALPPLAKYCEDNKLNLSINFLHHGLYQLNAITASEQQLLMDWANTQTSQYTLEAKIEVFDILKNTKPVDDERQRYKQYVKFLDSIRHNDYESVFGKLTD